MVVQVPGISVGNDQCTTGLICPTLQYSSWNTVEIEIASAENRKSTLVIAIADIMTGFT